MRLTNKDQLNMVKLHVEEGVSLSHVCEKYETTDISRLKYWCKVYRIHGEQHFIDRTMMVYRRDSKLLAISRVKNGETIRSVSADLGLIDPGVLSDWIEKYDKDGEAAI